MTERAARVRVFPHRDDLARAASEEFITCLSGGTREQPRRVLLSGGRTPEPMYRLLASEPCKSRVDWTVVECYFGDERPVPPDHPDSNFGLARRTLLEPLGLMAPRTYRIRGETSDLALSARRYEALIRDRLRTPSPMAPSFDLVFLGLGEDGHTASIFPGVELPSDPARLVVAVWVESRKEWRATVTYRVLNAAKRVTFIVAGEEKAEAVRRSLLPGPGEPPPAARIGPVEGELVWLIDQSAARLLPRDGGLAIEEASEARR